MNQHKGIYKIVLPVLLIFLLPGSTYAQSESAPEFILFLGRLHPLVLHLPIGFLMLAFFFEFLSRNEKFKYLAPATGFTLGLGAASALIAAMFGYFLSLEGGYGEDALAIHKWLGIALVVLSVGLFIIKTRVYSKPLMKKIYSYTFIVMALVLTATGHFGGNLTHGEDYITYYMPNSLRSLAGLEPRKASGTENIVNFDEAVIFTDLIQPVLEDKCVSCHNTSKTKGELQLHTIEAIQKGGENGEIFVGGDPDNSTIYKHITLPLEDEKHMPPDGKKQLTRKEIELIHWWIQTGGSFDYTVAEVSVPENVDAIFTSMKEEMAKVLNPAYEVDLSRVSDSEIIELNEKGIKVNHIAQNNPLVQVKVKSADENPLGLLRSIRENVTWLDLSETGISDDGMEGIDDFPNLTKLYLQNTKITDKSLEYISELPYLEYLNVYGTEVSDEGVQLLQANEYLTSLYLWQTKVTEVGRDSLQALNPDLKVELGLSLSNMDTIRLSAPKVTSEKTFFKDTTTVEAEMRFEGVTLYYTLDGSDPDTTSLVYEGPVTIDKSATFKVFAVKEGWMASDIVELDFTQVKYLPEAISLKNKPSEQYKGSGVSTLIDSQKGTLDYGSGKWLGFHEDNLIAEIDMGEVINCKNVKLSCLENNGAYIFLPTGITVSVSSDGKKYQNVHQESIKFEERVRPAGLKQYTIPVNKDGIRYIKVEAENMGRCPKWHPGAGDKAWLFVDEIIVE